MKVPCKRRRRSGITLFEVVIALVIFTLTLPALHTLVQMGTRRAEQSAYLAKASLECRSKLAEIAVGAEAMESTGWTELVDADGNAEPNWFWKVNAVQGDVDTLMQVQVTVKFEPNGALAAQASLSQMLLDPMSRGSTQDRGLIDAALAASTGASSTTPSTTAPAAAAPAAAAPAAAAPATGGTP
jgi:Tfp pilus assembly protein PilV